MLTESGRTGPPPDFSICVPQYNRTSFLLAAIRSYAEQRGVTVEVCISDGASPDGRQAEVREALQASGLPFAFAESPVNLRYDANLRAAIGLARGRYCLLMGNDDRFPTADTLARLWADIQAHEYPGVVISEYADDRTGARANAIRHTINYGGGPRVAAMHYRNFSFVSGIALDREAAQALITDRWDGSEMYQTYLGCRIIASGRSLLERDTVTVFKDIHIPGEQVDSYARRPKVWPCPIIERSIPLARFGRLVADAIAPYTGANAAKYNEAILFQLLGITYPYWLTEYRRVQSWQFAVGIARGMRPTHTAAGVTLSWWRKFRVWCMYWAATAGGLFVPPAFFDYAKKSLHRLAKSIR